MPHYLFSASYTQQGIQGLIKEGAQSRIDAINALAGSVGGKIDAVYWAFGKDDIFLVADLPGNAAAAAVASTVAASGAANVRTTVLLTAAEVDEALRLSPAYRPPGS